MIGKKPRRTDRRKKSAFLAASVAAGAMAIILGVTAALSDTNDGTIPSPQVSIDLTGADSAQVKATSTVENRVWRVMAFINSKGQLCAGETVPGEGQAYGCASQDQWLKDGVLFAQAGAGQKPGSGPHPSWDNIWVWGMSNPVVKGIIIEMADGAKIDAPINPTGYFIMVFDQAELQSQGLPTGVIALDARGNSLSTVKLHVGSP